MNMFYTNYMVQQNKLPYDNSSIKYIKSHEKFTEIEDQRLREVVARFEEYDWNVIASEMPGRNPRQCKERWTYYLSPTLNTSPWTNEEDNLLLMKQMELGSKWVKISKFFDNRTDAMVKNRFNVLMRKKKKGLLNLPMGVIFQDQSSVTETIRNPQYRSTKEDELFFFEKHSLNQWMKNELNTIPESNLNCFLF